MQRLTLVSLYAYVLHVGSYNSCFLPYNQTFMTLGLVDVASRVGLAGTDKAEKYIRDMVSHLERLGKFPTISSPAAG